MIEERASTAGPVSRLIQEFGKLPGVGPLSEASGAVAVTLTVVQSADQDGDGDVDLSDFSFFQACFNGPNRLRSESGYFPFVLMGISLKQGCS